MANDAAVTQRLALTLVTAIRPDLTKPADALTRWSKRRGRKALQGLKAALKDFRATPAFWSQSGCRSKEGSVNRSSRLLS